jgi:hypothetical protein
MLSSQTVYVLKPLQLGSSIVGSAWGELATQERIDLARDFAQAGQSSRSRRERRPMRMSANPKGAAFLHHRNWNDFWHNLNLKNR